MKKNMKQCLMWMRWKMPEKWCTFFPHPNFYLSTTFFVSLLTYFLKSNQYQLHQLNYINCYILSPIPSTTYIDANPIKKTKQERNFLKIKKTTTVAWNCLCFTLIYYQSSFMLLRTTIYWQIGIKKNWDQFSAQKLPCLFNCLHSSLWWFIRIYFRNSGLCSQEYLAEATVLRVMRPTFSASKEALFFLSWKKFFEH